MCCLVLIMNRFQKFSKSKIKKNYITFNDHNYISVRANEQIVLPMFAVLSNVPQTKAVREIINVVVNWWLKGFYEMNLEKQFKEAPKDEMVINVLNQFQ